MEHAIAELTGAQHNVVALGQLERLGLTDSAVRKRFACGRLHRVQPGVYAVGHGALTAKGRWMAAVLSCGDGAVLSHRSAGALHGFRPDNRPVCDVTSSGRAGRKRPGIHAHRATRLTPADVTVIDGIPCTSVARTLLDLAETVSRRELERAIDRAEVLRVLDSTAIHDVLQRNNGRRATPLLLSAVAEHHAGSTLTESQLEELFLQICHQANLPRPEVNVWIALPDTPCKVDFLWRHHRLIVETDGHATHRTRYAFEHDRQRDQQLMLAGWRVIRFTWRQLTQEPDRV